MSRPAITWRPSSLWVLKVEISIGWEPVACHPGGWARGLAGLGEASSTPRLGSGRKGKGT